MSDPLQSSASRYAVNPQTGKVVRLSNGAWEPVQTARNAAGDILINEGGQWRPFRRGNSEITTASERANSARQAGQPIAASDIATLGRLDLSEAAFSRLPPAAAGAGPSQASVDEWLNAMQTGGEVKRQYDRGQRMEQIDRNLPDSNLKERFIAFANPTTFGNAPRLAAGVQTLGALAATPFVEGDIIDREGISGATQTFLDEARVHQRRGREERPIESLALEVVPALLTGKTLIDDVGKKILPGTTTTSNVARVMGVGAGYGAAYGASQDESGTLQGAGEGALFGGAIGGVTGGLFKAAEAPATVGVRSVKQAGASLYDALASLVGKQGGARDKVALEVAEAAVRRSMDRSGLTFQQIMDLAKKYEGKPAVFAEIIGQDAVNALTALTRRPGSTPQKAQDIIEERFYGRPDRMKGDVEDATGIQIGQLDETLETQLAERQAAAKPIYEALYKRFNKIEDFRQPGQTGQVMKRLNRLGRTPLAQRHLQLAKDAVATAAGRRGIAISKMSKMEYWDLVKRSLDNAIESAQKRGEGSTRVGEDLRDLVGLKDDLVTELDRLTGGAYAAAREAGGEAPRLKAAATAGQKALQARNPRDVAKTVAATLSQDLPALRAGIVDDLGTRIDKGMTPGRVRVPDVAGKLREGLGEEAANKLINRFDAEATLSEIGARWAPRMNSVTGTVMESGATALGDDLVNAGFNLATGNKVGLMRQAINFMRQRGFSQRQIDAIGDLLLSSPEEGLKRLGMMAPDGTPLPAGRTNAFSPNATAPMSSAEVSPTFPASGAPPRPPLSGPPAGGGTAAAGFGFNPFAKRPGPSAAVSEPMSNQALMGEYDRLLPRMQKATRVFQGQDFENVPGGREALLETIGKANAAGRGASDDQIIEQAWQLMRRRQQNGPNWPPPRDSLQPTGIDEYGPMLGRLVANKQFFEVDLDTAIRESLTDLDDMLARDGLRRGDDMVNLDQLKRYIDNPKARDANLEGWQPASGTRANGFPSALRQDLGNAASGALGGGIMPMPSTGDPEQDMRNRLGMMAAGAGAGFAGRRLSNAFAPEARSMGVGGGRKPPKDSPEAIRAGVQKMVEQVRAASVNTPRRPPGQLIVPRGSVRGAIVPPDRAAARAAAQAAREAAMAQQVPPPLPALPPRGMLPVNRWPTSTEGGLIAATAGTAGAAALMERINRMRGGKPPKTDTMMSDYLANSEGMQR